MGPLCSKKGSRNQARMTWYRVEEGGKNFLAPFIHLFQATHWTNIFRKHRSNHHAGNVNFRKIVNKIRPTYIRSDKREKPTVSFRVVKEIRCLDPPGRFLRQEKKDELWYEIGNKKAREKASQALRDGTSMFSRKYASDTDLTSNSFRKPESVQGKVKCESSDDSSVDTPSLASTDTFQVDCKFKKPDLKAPSNVTNHKRKKSITNSISKKNNSLWRSKEFDVLSTGRH